MTWIVWPAPYAATAPKRPSFLLSMPGAPFIYYGDEIGMRYVENLTSVEGGYGRTGSRSPMQWDSSEGAGFSEAPAGKFYIPLDPDAGRPDVAAQLADADSLLNEVKRLIGIRQAHEALRNDGGITFVCDGAKGKPLAYFRDAGNERILVVINPTDEDRIVSSGSADGELLYFTGRQPVFSAGELVVSGRSAVFWKVK